MLYAAFAFRGISKPVKSSRYGYITILALTHDVLVPAAVFAAPVLIGAEVDVLFVMAFLAVLVTHKRHYCGFDCVRENLLLNKELENTDPLDM